MNEPEHGKIVLDYATPKAAKQPMPGWKKAIVFGVVAFMLGAMAGTEKGGLSMLAIPFVWYAGVWYALARIVETGSPRWEKATRGCISVILLVATPLLYCERPGAPSVVADLMNRGWHAKYVSDGSRALIIIAIGLVVLMGILDLKRLIRRWRGIA
jgi:hypothetical protein